MSNLSSLINRFNLVKQIPIFADLNWLDLQKIARKAIVSEYKKGDIICKEGDPPDFFYCLVSGRLQAYRSSAAGKKGDIDFIHRWMYFGIISILTGDNHSMTFEAINDSIVLTIPDNDFQAILKTIPHLGIRLSQTLSQRIQQKERGAKSVFQSSVISIYSPVGGSGSSTYAVNLALNLERETKKKVILVNIQSLQHHEHAPQEAATPHWKMPPVNLNDIIGDHEKILSSAIRSEINIHLLNVAFDPHDTHLKNQIGAFVSVFVGDYHYVVVDMPTEMDDIVLETLTQSDIVHLVTFDRKKDLELIRHVLGRLEGTLKGRFREEKIRVIVRALHSKAYLSLEEINQHIDYQIYAALPTIHREDLTEMTESQHLYFMRPESRSDYARALTRIAREIAGVLVGLALGGGAALGVAHIGVLKVLEEENIQVDVVAGSSMGALIAGLWAVGKNSSEIEKIAREFETKKSLSKLLDPVFPVRGLIAGHAIRRWLKKHFGSTTFYSTKIPLKIVVYDLIRRNEIVIDSGSVAEAIRKSVAIPGVIEPVIEGERLIIDGGVLNPLPTNVLSSRGIKKIIAVNVLQSPDDTCEGFEMAKHAEQEQAKIPFAKAPYQYLTFRIGRALLAPLRHNISDIIVRTLQATEYLIAEQSAQQADVVIHPDLVGINWFELYKVTELIKRGEEAAREVLPEIRKLVETA